MTEVHMKLSKKEGPDLAFRRDYLLSHLLSPHRPCPQMTGSLGWQDLSPRSAVPKEKGSRDPQLTFRSHGLMA